MDNYELLCSLCGWVGHSQELVCLTDEPEDRDFSYCPACEKKDGIESIDPDDES